MPGSNGYTIFPISDSALTIDFGNFISEHINRKVLSLFQEFQQHPIPGMVEAVPAYSSLTIYYDVWQVRKMTGPNETAMEWIKTLLEMRLNLYHEENFIQSDNITIPVCYDRSLAKDMDEVSRNNKLSPEEIIHLHTSLPYRVYMIGFLPGFPYLGVIDEKLEVTRKPQPVPVEAGSVGIAGRQTGIYPLASPGGWQIIGRTPVKLFDPNKHTPTLLKAGDIVNFVSITKDEFAHY